MTYQQILEFLRTRLAKAGMELVSLGEVSEYRPGMISTNAEIKEKFDCVPLWDVAYRITRALNKQGFVWQIWRASPVARQYHLALILVSELHADASQGSATTHSPQIKRLSQIH